MHMYLSISIITVININILSEYEWSLRQEEAE